MSVPASAISQQMVWKNPELRRFCVALIRAALETGGDFTTDLVPDETREMGAVGDDIGQGIAGSAVTLLKHANVIKPVGVYSSGRFYSHRMESTRPSAKTRYLNAYQLTSIPLAQEFLRRNDVAAPSPDAATPPQSEMFSEPKIYP